MHSLGRPSCAVLCLVLMQVPQGKGRIALVGFREWIFSEDSGALAEFAAATERSFGTTVQRLMHNPGAPQAAATTVCVLQLH